MTTSKQEDEWQRAATRAAIDGARKVVLAPGPLMNVPIGRISDHEWGMIVAAVIFGWIEVRVRQAIAEGRDKEEVVRLTGLDPSPCDVAVVTSIQPELADKAEIDWSQPLASWPKEVMTDFLMLAWRLISEAEALRDHGPGGILRRKEKEAEYDEKVGDPIPF
jgi:hypothetical protein